MGKLAIVATIKTSPGKRDEFLKHLSAHAERCRANEPGTLQFDILVPQKEEDTVMLYELYASSEAFKVHLDGESMKQMKRDADGLSINISGAHCDLAE